MPDRVILPKSVSSTLVFAVIIQTLSLVWGGSQINSAVKANTADIIRVQTEIEVMERTVQDQAVSMARIDENISAIRDSMERVVRNFDMGK